MSWVTKVKQLTNDARAELKARFDSWTNAMTALGTARDKTTYTQPFLDAAMPAQTLEAMYHGDDIAARMISAMPDECFREGVVVMNKSAANELMAFLKENPNASKESFMRAGRAAMKSQPDSVQQQATELQRDLDNLGAVQKFREAMTWGRLYGLGAIFLGAQDGREPWEPLNPEGVREVTFATVLDKRDLTPWRWYADVEAPKFGDVAIYLLQPVGVYVGAPYEMSHSAQVLLVHETRLIRFGGELTSKRLKLANQGSDYSILQKAFRALQLVNDNWQSASALLADASQGVFKIRGLIDMIAGDAEIMTQRFAFMDMVRSTFRAILLDAGEAGGEPSEEFTRVATPFAGIPEMLEHTFTRASAAARMPKVVLFGSSTKGLGDTGDSELRWWYDTVKSTQTQNVLPQMEWLLRLLATAHGYQDVDQWSVIFPPLRQQTLKEEAETHFQQAQADKNYHDMGWITPEEGSLSRFGSGKYSLETKIDVESRKRIMQIRAKQMEAEAQNELDAAEDPSPTPGAIAAQQQAPTTTPDTGAPPRSVES